MSDTNKPTAPATPEQEQWSKHPGAEEDARFLRGPDSRLTELRRVVGITFEFIRALRALHFVGPCVTVFGSARFGEDHPHYIKARQLGRLISEAGFTVMTGGGPGIMEAANRGAQEAGAPSVGFNISLPFEQEPNPYITPDLSFDFHYFFMRKLWFAYLGKALIAFPGGFGTLDELLEVLTLVQTNKLRKKVLVLVYGREYWEKVINMDALVEYGTISPEDLDHFRFADTPLEAYKTLTEWLTEKYL